MTTPPRTGLGRLWYVASWRVRYWWLDTRAGLVAQLLVSLAFAAVGCWTVWRGYAAGVEVRAGELPMNQAIADWVVYAIMFVASVIISLALAPKIKGAAAQKVEVPIVEDGAVIRRIYGPVWIKDPVMLAFKPAGTTAIRKKAGKSWKLKTKWQTVGYHYSHIFQFGLCRGQLDSVLAIRAGDKEAWSGQLTSGGIISVNKPNLWGGEDAEGGIVGDFEFAFGNPGQAPSSYLAANVAPQQSAYRWRPYATFRGGRWGNSPYPKPPAFLVSRILQGWDGGECWYPERAQVPVYSVTSTRPTSIYITMDRSGSMAGNRMTILKAAMQTVIDRLEVWEEETRQDLDVMLVSFGSDSQSITRRGISGPGFGDLRAFVDAMVASGGTSATAAYSGAPGFFSPTPPRNNVVVAVSDGAMSDVAAAVSAVADLLDRDATPYCTADNNAVAMYGVGITTAGSLASFSNMGPPSVIDGSSADELAELILSALLKVTGFGGMNIAHVLYDSLTAREMDGESRALINEASWRAAADRLYNESFGIGTEFIAGQETIEQFQQRLCDLAGARMSVDPTTGEWHLDLIRSDVPDDILTITDDDVLEFEEQPSVLDEAVNQVTARWTNMLNDEVRATAPVQALGAIQSFGAVNAEVLECPEVLAESLALRLAARNLDARATPLKRHALKVTRMAYRARPGQKARLQLPKRGIADMVVVLGDISRGTLRSGAMALTTVQDVASMPASTYIVEEPGVDASVPQEALPAPAQRVFETPYAELVQLLTDADLAYMAPAAGYVTVVAADPGGGIDYQLWTSVDGGEYDEAAVGLWCPTALVVEASTVDDPAGGVLRTEFTLTQGSRLGSVALGSAALWGDEIVRVDALDVATGAVTLARGCVDTVPQEHAAGERIWFYDDFGTVDPEERGAGQEISGKVLTRTSSDVLALAGAPGTSSPLAGRAARPYPPANLLINGVAAPPEVTGAVTLEWANRNRVLQADELMDTTMPGVAIEPGTSIVVETYNEDTGAPVMTISDVAGESLAMPPGALVYHNRLEVYSVRDGHESWQRHVCRFTYGFEIMGAVPGAACLETYSAQLTAGGATAPVQWSIVAGSLPRGLHLVQDGTEIAQINGVADDATGYYSVTIRAEDAVGAVIEREIQIPIGRIVSLLHLDGTNGQTTITDASGKSWTRSGNAQLSTESPRFGAAAALFDGLDDFWQTSHHADFSGGSDHLTVRAWVRPASQAAASEYRGVVTKWGSNSSGACWQVNHTNGRFVFQVSPSGSTSGMAAVSTVSDADVGAWQWVTAGWEPLVSYISLNGVVARADTEVSSVSTSSSTVKIGRYGTSSGGWASYNGLIDEVAIIRGAVLYKEDHPVQSASSDYPQPPPAVAINGALPAGSAGAPYDSGSAIQVHGAGPFTVSVESGSLPGDWTAVMVGTDLVVSGGAVAAADYTFTLRVTSGSGTAALPLTVRVI